MNRVPKDLRDLILEYYEPILGDSVKIENHPCELQKIETELDVEEMSCAKLFGSARCYKKEEVT